MIATMPSPRTRTVTASPFFWIITSPLATLRVECGPKGVSRIHFVDQQDWEEHTEAAGLAQQRFQQEHSWVPRLLADLKAYLEGERVSFAGVPVDITGQSPFRQRVLLKCREISYGETLTYAELAGRVGHPAAVRAVGSAMRHNPLAIVIPCHRVLRSDGGLGGYSAPGGVGLKRRLLDLEGRQDRFANPSHEPRAKHWTCRASATERNLAH